MDITGIAPAPLTDRQVRNFLRSTYGSWSEPSHAHLMEKATRLLTGKGLAPPEFIDWLHQRGLILPACKEGHTHLSPLGERVMAASARRLAPACAWRHLSELAGRIAYVNSASQEVFPVRIEALLLFGSMLAKGATSHGDADVIIIPSEKPNGMRSHRYRSTLDILVAAVRQSDGFLSIDTSLDEWEALSHREGQRQPLCVVWSREPCASSKWSRILCHDGRLSDDFCPDAFPHITPRLSVVAATFDNPSLINARSFLNPLATRQGRAAATRPEIPPGPGFMRALRHAQGGGDEGLEVFSKGFVEGWHGAGGTFPIPAVYANLLSPSVITPSPSPRTVVSPATPRP